MREACEQYQVLITGYLDGELAPDDKSRLEEHVRLCDDCRREYDSLKRLVVGTTHALAADDPPGEVWDTFLDGVYNRMERRFGWALFAGGLIALIAYGSFLFFTQHWVSALLFTVPAVGLGLLFLSVLRQRLRAAVNDRYTKEVYR
jgi:anti-sigma factor RsiW